MSVVAEHPVPATARPKGAERAEGSGWDLWLLASVAGLISMGFLYVLSASGPFGSHAFDDPWFFTKRQIVGLLLGTGVALVALAIPWRWYRRMAFPAYGLTTLMVYMVHLPIIGHAAKGAPRWIDIGPFNIQPSELAKPALALAIAHYLARNEGHLKDFMGVVAIPVGIGLAPMLLGIALQSDLGALALLVGIVGVGVFVAGIEWKWLGALAGAIAALVTGLVLMEPYRMKRIVGFLDPLGDAQKDGYQVVQGWVAFAEGGLFGKGLGQGVAQQGFLPEAHTDMISAVVTEELGVFGWSILIVLYAIMLWRGTRIAMNATGLFEMVLASCLSAVLAAQVVVNLGVVAGLVPPKGLVLPFMSYGASALIAHILMIAILLRVGLETRRAEIAAEIASAPRPRARLGV